MEKGRKFPVIIAGKNISPVAGGTGFNVAIVLRHNLSRPVYVERIRVKYDESTTAGLRHELIRISESTASRPITIGDLTPLNLIGNPDDVPVDQPDFHIEPEPLYMPANAEISVEYKGTVGLPANGLSVALIGYRYI